MEFQTNKGSSTGTGVAIVNFRTVIDRDSSAITQQPFHRNPQRVAIVRSSLVPADIAIRQCVIGITGKGSRLNNLRLPFDQ
jgi:hypothetical protein